MFFYLDDRRINGLENTHSNEPLLVFDDIYFRVMNIPLNGLSRFVCEQKEVIWNLFAAEESPDRSYSFLVHQWWLYTRDISHLCSGEILRKEGKDDL